MGCIGFIVWRANAVFNIPKWRAFAIAALLFLPSVPLMFMTNPAAIISVFWPFAAIYGAIFCFKWCRDMDILIRTEQDTYNPLPETTRPAMTDQGSNRLFVPGRKDK